MFYLAHGMVGIPPYRFVPTCDECIAEALERMTQGGCVVVDRRTDRVERPHPAS